MHSLEDNAPPAGRVLVASQDIFWAVYPQILTLQHQNNWVSLRRPSVPFVLINFTDIC